MKVTCKNCGKGFQYERHMGICPKCGRYFEKDRGWGTVHGESTYWTPATEGEKIEPEEQAERAEQEEQAEPEEQEEQAEQEEPQIRVNLEKAQDVQKGGQFQRETVNKQNPLIYLGFVILVVVLFGVFSLISKMMLEREISRVYQMQKVTKVSKQQIEIGKSYKTHDYSFSVDTPKLFEHDGLQAPEGWKYVDIPYESNYVHGHDSDVEESSHVYMLIDGTFYESMSPYDMTEDENLREELDDRKLSWNELELSVNRWVFLVPEDEDEMTLYINAKFTKEGKGYDMGREWTENIYLLDIRLEGEENDEQ